MVKIKDLYPGMVFLMSKSEEREDEETYGGYKNHRVGIRTLTGYLPLSSMTHIEGEDYPEYMDLEVETLESLPVYQTGTEDPE